MNSLITVHKEPFYVKVLKTFLSVFFSIDWTLLAIVTLLSAWGFVTLYSAGYSFPWRIDGQIRNLAAAGAAMLVFANIPQNIRLYVILRFSTRKPVQRCGYCG